MSAILTYLTYLIVEKMKNVGIFPFFPFLLV